MFRNLRWNGSENRPAEKVEAATGMPREEGAFAAVYCGDLAELGRSKIEEEFWGCKAAEDGVNTSCD